MRHHIPLPRRNDHAERSAPRPSWEKPDCRRWAHQEGPERGMARIPDSNPCCAPFRGSGPLRHVTQRVTGTLTALWAGASSGRLAEGPHRRWPCRGPGAIIASMAALRRPQQGERSVRPIPAGLGGAPQLTYSRRELAPPPAYRGARSEPCHALLSVTTMSVESRPSDSRTISASAGSSSISSTSAVFSWPGPDMCSPCAAEGPPRLGSVPRGVSCEYARAVGFSVTNPPLG